MPVPVFKKTSAPTLSSLKPDTELYVFDIYGKLIASEQDYSKIINLSEFKKGIYIITSELDDNIITNKIILH